MNLEQMKARLAVIVAELKAIAETEELSAEQIETANAHNEEFSALKAKIETAEAISANLASVSTPARKTAPVANSSIVVGNELVMENGNFGYQNSGQYFQAIKNLSYSKSDDKIEKVQASQRESVGADGGFLVPEDMIDGIQSAIESDDSLLSRCNQFNTSGNRASLKVNESAPWEGNGTHVTAYWTGEGKPITASQAKFKEVEIKAEKLAALIPVTEELMEDTALISSFLKKSTPEVFVAAINNAIVSGDGVKKPTGFLNSSFGFEVAKEAAQAADTIEFANLKKLHTHALPKAKRSGIYVYNAGVEEQLIGMKLDKSGTDSPSVYLPNGSISGAPYGTLWGKPAFPMIGAMPKLGDKGDICFIDLSYYWAVLKVGGLKESISTHLYFDTDEVAFKYTFRMGGLCPFSAPQGTEYGDYKLSGFT
jgi:HK97 family phage major capsid protein